MSVSDNMKSVVCYHLVNVLFCVAGHLILLAFTRAHARECVTEPTFYFIKFIYLR